MTDVINNGECNKMEQQSQVYAQMGYIGKRLDVVHGSLQQLEERLQPVLRSETQKDGEGCAREELVPLANSLMSFADQIVDIDSRISNIIERLEL